MAESPAYNYHPRWLRRRVSTYWWLEKGSYFAFVLREGSCLFVAWFVFYLLLLIRDVRQGEAAYQALLAWSARPSILLLNIVSFAFLLLHAVTFFDAAPRALVVHVGSKRVPERMIGLSHYAAWFVASAVVIWLVMGV
jgi:succinate dehydrogenase subunit C